MAAVEQRHDELVVSVGERMNQLAVAREFDEAITDLAKAVGMTAIETGQSSEYAAVVAGLVKVRRTLRAQFNLVV